MASIPASIGYLTNLEYLFLFNNQLTFLPEEICNLTSLNWDDYDQGNYPYFASGGNMLCDSALIPDCVENSANFEISMEQFYYSFLQDDPQDCILMGDLNGDCVGGTDLNAQGNYCFNVLDIVVLANCVLAEDCTG